MADIILDKENLINNSNQLITKINTDMNSAIGELNTLRANLSKTFGDDSSLCGKEISDCCDSLIKFINTLKLMLEENINTLYQATSHLQEMDGDLAKKIKLNDTEVKR